jgi:hypothetical protein
MWLLVLLAISVYAGTDLKVNQDINTSVQNEPSITINRHFTSDPLNIVVGYNDIGTSLGISFSPDSGKTWTDLQLPPVFNVHGDPSVASDNLGNVYACFLSYSSTITFQDTSGIFVCKSTDGGRSWSPPVAVDTQIYRGGPLVKFADKCMMTVDTNSGSPYENNIYVGWQRDDTNGHNSDVFFAYSNNLGASFSAPQQINSNPPQTAYAEGAFPFVGADGDVYMAWYDCYFRMHEPGSLYVAKSTNGGVSFGSNIKVANVDGPPLYTFGNTGFKAKTFISAAGDPNDAERLYMTYISDPDGYFDRRLDNGKHPGVPGSTGSDWPVIDREGNHVYVAWRDYRSGAQDIYFNRSADNGQSWELPDIGPLDNGDTPGASTSWKQQLSSTGSNVYCVWEDYRLGGSSHIYFNRSLNNGLTWQSDIIIDGGGAYAASDPMIASTGSYVYAVWSDSRNGSNDIYFNVSSNSGLSWGVPKRIDLGDNPGTNHSVQPRIACIGNYVYVMWLDFRTGTTQVFFNYSTNNGTTWGNPSIQLCTGTGYNCQMPVRGGLECTGTFVYACWVDDRTTTGVNDVYFTSSTNNGVNWNADVQLNSPGGNCFMPSLDYENNNVYVAWQDDRMAPGSFTSDIYFAYSNNNGASWQPDQNLDNFPGIPDQVVELKSEGKYVYAMWFDSRRFGMPGMGDVFFRHSTDSGATWAAETQINWGSQPGGLQNSVPFMSCGNGYVNITWADPRMHGIPNIYINYSTDNGATWLSGMDESDVYCVKSTNGGTSWGTPVKVNDDATIYAQVLPWVVIKENGTVDISYYNFRSTPIDPMVPGAELRLAASLDGGNSFQPSFALQDTVVTPWTQWVGEYNGMAVLDTMVYTVFTDFEQSGNSDIYLDVSPNPASSACQGECGDANNDKSVNVSDAVWVINYVFIGGSEPQPVLACGDANGDGAVNVSDAVWIINYVFIGGAQPGTCSPGSPNWYNGNCCVFTP